MAKILCGISGIEFNCEHVPMYLHSREYAHPIFFLEQKKLLGLYQKYRHGELGDIDSYLLFLAYLNSTDLVEWRVPAAYHIGTSSIIALNFEALVNAVERMNRVKNPSVHFSHIAVSPDTRKLENVAYWIQAWEVTYEDFVSGYATQRQRQEIADLEEKLDYLCNDANRSELQFASRLAVWADKAGEFPRYAVQTGSVSLPCNLYWQQIIRKCTNAESIFNIPQADLQKLLEHCESNIDVGSTYAFHLFKILREGIKKQNNFLGLGDFQFSFVSEDTKVEDANKIAIIQNAPLAEPKRIDYPSEFQFIKAKLAYDMARAHREAAESEDAKKSREDNPRNAVESMLAAEARNIQLREEIKAEIFSELIDDSEDIEDTEDTDSTDLDSISTPEED